VSNAHRVIIGPITRTTAAQQRIKYGALTLAQFNALERIDMLGVATALDLAGHGRTEESAIRTLHRLHHQGWIESTVNGESWRLTDRGSTILGFAYAHLDAIAMNIEGDDDNA
jgi:hypothetical protein